MNDWNRLYLRAETLLSRLEGIMTADQPEPDWNAAAFRWRKRGHTSTIEPVRQPDCISFDALQGIERQKNLLDQNTYQFVQGHPANNVLLTGARGTGKSSLVKAMLNKYAAEGLRLIEVGKHDLIDLPDIVEQIYHRPERFILYCEGRCGMSMADTDNDGKVSRDEHARHADMMFEKMDTNRDGYIDRDEASAMKKKHRGHGDSYRSGDKHGDRDGRYGDRDGRYGDRDGGVDIHRYREEGAGQKYDRDLPHMKPMGQ